MFESIKNYIENLKHNKALRKRTVGLFLVLAAFVAGGVFWHLRIIGITKTADAMCGYPEHIHTDECVVSKTLICGYPEDDTQDEEQRIIVCTPIQHIHTEACFDETGSLVCGYADFVIHSHNQSCFNEWGELICTLPEILPHEHTDECYCSETIWHCGFEETAEQPGHSHSDECYQTEQALICALEENEEHTHGEECYNTVSTLICAVPESEPTEGHIHTPDCEHEEIKTLICPLTEAIEHIHTPECYDLEGNRICGRLEVHSHIHTDECFMVTANNTAEGHVHTDECYITEQTLICTLEENEEHSHSDECYSTVSTLICELPEGEPEASHVHTDDCYEIIYGCGIMEHTHSVFCYADYNADIETYETWMSTLPALSGNISKDIVAVAKSQLGYAESERNFVLDELGVRKSYTRYGAWYGNPYGDWNAMFAAFCLHYAGVPQEIVPTVGGCYAWYSVLMDNGLLVTAEDAADMGYYPQPSDLVFFDTDGDGIADRVGIVSELVNFGYNTIEGDVKTESGDELVIPDSIAIDEISDNIEPDTVPIENINSDLIPTPDSGFDGMNIGNLGTDAAMDVFGLGMFANESMPIEGLSQNGAFGLNMPADNTINTNTDAFTLPQPTDISADDNLGDVTVDDADLGDVIADDSNLGDVTVDDNSSSGGVIADDSGFVDLPFDDGFVDNAPIFNGMLEGEESVDLSDEPSSDYVGEVMHYYDDPTVVGYAPLSMLFGEVDTYSLTKRTFKKVEGTRIPAESDTTGNFDAGLSTLIPGTKFALVCNLHFLDNTDPNKVKEDNKYVLIPGVLNEATTQKAKEITKSEIDTAGVIENVLTPDDCYWTIEAYNDPSTAAEGDETDNSGKRYRIKGTDSEGKAGYLVINSKADDKNNGLCFLADDIINREGLLNYSIFKIQYNWGNALIYTEVAGTKYYLKFYFPDTQAEDQTPAPSPAPPIVTTAAEDESSFALPSADENMLVELNESGEDLKAQGLAMPMADSYALADAAPAVTDILDDASGDEDTTVTEPIAPAPPIKAPVANASSEYFNYDTDTIGHTSFSIYYYTEETFEDPDTAENDKVKSSGAVENLPPEWYTHSDIDTLGTYNGYIGDPGSQGAGLGNLFTISADGFALTVKEDTIITPQLGFVEPTYIDNPDNPQYIRSDLQWYFEKYVGNGCNSETFTVRIYTYVKGQKQYLSLENEKVALGEGLSHLAKYSATIVGEGTFILKRIDSDYYITYDQNTQSLSATRDVNQATPLKIYKDGEWLKNISAYKPDAETDVHGELQQPFIPQYTSDDGKTYLLVATTPDQPEVSLAIVSDEFGALSNGSVLSGIRGNKLELDAKGNYTNSSLAANNVWGVLLNPALDGSDREKDTVKVYTKTADDKTMYLHAEMVGGEPKLYLKDVYYGATNFYPYVSSSGAVMLEAFQCPDYYLGIDPGTNLFKLIKYDGTNNNPPGNIELSFIREVTTVPSVEQPAGTIINLFDYWIDKRGDIDNPENWGDDKKDNPYGRGINQNHLLKFRVNSQSAETDINWNWWTESAAVRSGIIKRKLGTDGFPQLNGDPSSEKPNLVTPDMGKATESLAYLFDPHVYHEGKQSFANVQGLLQQDNDRYYYYDSQKNFARFVEDESKASGGEFVLYDAIGCIQQKDLNVPEDNGWFVKDKSQYGQFFPFNDLNQCSTVTSTANLDWTFNDPDKPDKYDHRHYNKKMNHYFGMTLTTRFIQRNDGRITADQKAKPCVFNFTGDDDVWIFIDGVLVADLGGIHNTASVSINFVTGEILINGGSAEGDKTTIRAMFDAADEQRGPDYWNGNTFADETTHVLKFFYLERGNNASNCSLSYLLNEAPITSVDKVDQYGNPLEGATFAIYKADKSYNYYYSDGTVRSAPLPDWAQPNRNNNWKIDIDNNTIEPLFIGTTDESGKLIFNNEYGAPYTISEMREVFGDRLILREVDVPRGYRKIAEEIHMYIENGLLLVEEQYDTGVWSSPNALVNAPNSLNVGPNFYGNSEVLEQIGAQHITDTDGVLRWVIPDFYNPGAADGLPKTKGTLFAVVLKRNGLDPGETNLSELDVSSWHPVYGSEEKGYTVLDSKGTDINQVISAAKAQIAHNGGDESSVVFSPKASGMQVNLRNLPGDPKSYYSYMADNNSSAVTNNMPEYFVAFYYTSANSLDGANANNTVRILSRKSTVVVDGQIRSNNRPFSVSWGSTIRVPNFENKLFVQKLDSAENLVTDAVFALYGVKEYNGKYYYNMSKYDYVADLKLDEIASANNGVITGTADIYEWLGENTEPQLVASGFRYTVNVFDYNNAGKESGYIVADTVGGSDNNWGNINLKFDPNKEPQQRADLINYRHQGAYSSDFASDDYLGVLPSTAGDGEFFWSGTRLVGYTHDSCHTISEKGSLHFDRLQSGNYILREIHAPDGFGLNLEEIKVIVDSTGVYANAGDTENGVSVGNGLGYLARTMDTFASAGDIDQSLRWIYTTLWLKDKPDREPDTFAEFADKTNTTVPWQRVRKNGNSKDLFGIYEPHGFGELTTYNLSEAMVTYLEYNPAAAGTAEDGKSQVFNYMALAESQKNHGRDTLYGQGTHRLFTSHGWSKLSAYQDYTYGNATRQTPGDHPSATYTDLRENSDGTPKDLSHLFSNSTFVRVMDKSYVNLTLVKNDEKGSPLAGAEFMFYKLVPQRDEQNKIVVDDNGDPIMQTWYYSPNGDNAGWYTEKAAFTTGEDGKLQLNGIEIPFRKLEEGTYYLEETKAPDGYELLPRITITVGATFTGDDESKKPFADESGNILYVNTTNGTIKEESAGPGSFDYTLTVVDPLGETSIKVVKQDVNTKSSLTGAEFRLYQLSGENKQYYDLNEQGKLQWVGVENAETFKCGENGEFTIDYLAKNATYYLEEVTAPPGYIPLTYPIEINIVDGVVKVSETAGGLAEVGDKPDITTDNGKKVTYTLTVYNTTGVMLPQTGGIGTIYYTLGGFALMALSLMCGCIRIRGCVKRRRERREAA